MTAPVPDPVPVPVPESSELDEISPRFDHERLDVYRVALDFAVTANRVSCDFAFVGGGDLSDQLRRASTSIVLNIAEGAGEFRPVEKARFYRMASRSATECAAIVDIVAALSERFVEEREMRALLLRIVAMLTRMASSLQDRGRGRERGRGRS